jgi:1-acyl-sn-glycerol-3-phosphate acyltransferase
LSNPEPLPVPASDLWIRRAIIATAGLGFTLPYFELFNRLEETGAKGLLDRLPRRGVIFLSNHQTYFTEAIAFYHLVYIRHRFPTESPFLRFSAAEETMKKNLVTEILAKAGGVTFRRSFREGGVEVNRPVDLEGVSRVEDAIRDGWLLHFPTGTTQPEAPIRPGVAQLLHRTKAVAVPMRIDGFRGLLLKKQIPGRLFRKASFHLHEPLDLGPFYAEPYSKEGGRDVVARLSEILSDPA